MKIKIPVEIELENNEVLKLSLDDFKNYIFAFRIIDCSLSDLVKYLIMKFDFQKTSFVIPKGEIYSLTKMIEFPWEVHLRIYQDCFIVSEIEYCRFLPEHLLSNSINDVFTTIQFLKDFKYEIYFIPKSIRVKNFVNTLEIELSESLHIQFLKELYKFIFRG